MKIFLLGLGLLFLCWPATGWSDEIFLNSGDRLTGRITRLEDGKLTVETDFAGIVRIEWDRVSCLTTEGAHVFITAEKIRISGRAQCVSDGNLEIISGESGEPVPLSMAKLQGINPPPAVRYKGSLTAGGSAASGNTDSRAAYGSGRLEVRSKRQRLTLGARGNYAETDDTVTARNASGSAKYDFFLREKFFLYGQTLQEEDKLQDLDLRSIFGVGLGYQFFESSRLSLFAEAGASHVNEDYETAEDRAYPSGRWSVGLEWEIVPERIKFFHGHEVYVRLDDADDYYIRTEQGIRLPLLKNFFCNIEFDYDHKNKPAPGKKNADQRFMLGLGYEFSN